MRRGIFLAVCALLVHMCLGVQRFEQVRGPSTLSSDGCAKPMLGRSSLNRGLRNTEALTTPPDSNQVGNIQIWIQILFVTVVPECPPQSALEIGVRQSALGSYFPIISSVTCQTTFQLPEVGRTAFNLLVQAKEPPTYDSVAAQVEGPETALSVRQALSASLGKDDLNSVTIGKDFINQPPNDAPLNPPLSSFPATPVEPPFFDAPTPVQPPAKSKKKDNKLIIAISLVAVGVFVLVGAVTCYFCGKKRREQLHSKDVYIHHEMSKTHDRSVTDRNAPNGHAHVTVRSAPDPNMATPVKAVGVMDTNSGNLSHQFSTFPRVAVADSVFAQKFSPEVPNANNMPANGTDIHGSPEVQQFSSTPGSGTESLHVTRSQLLGPDSESGDLDSSHGLRPIRTSGKARVSKSTVTLPSAGDAYPLSAECSKMSSREVHRRLRSQSLRSQPAAEPEVPIDATAPVPRVVQAPSVDAASEASRSSKPTPPARIKSIPLVPPAVQPPAPAPEPNLADSKRSTSSLKEPEMTTSPRLPSTEPRAEPNGAWTRGGAAAGVAVTPAAGVGTLKVVRSSRSSAHQRAQNDGFSSRLSEQFSKVVTTTHGKTPRHLRGSPRMNSPSDLSSEWGASATLSVGHSASSFSSVSVMSEATTVYTDIGQGDIDDKVTAVERLLNRAQQELGGQVGSFRLKGPRYRFSGRSSVVAFAEGMWGGDYALKFYCDPEAAEREFNIYRQATELDMSLPDVQELEDNAGGVLRLRDGTPLPPFMAMLRGLPLPEWYALHVPSQIALLETLSQVVKRLEQLHASGFCHNDIKPANILLLDGPNGGLPRWHLVDFTSVAQVGTQIRARYTLEYVSPEFVRAVGAMRAHTIVCQRSMDIWSMGVIMYELMTCEPFFPLDAGRDMMRDGLMGLEPLPIEEDPRSIMRIPKEGRLRSTVMSMLSREPASRPSATKVVQSIHDCIKELTGESPNDAEETPISSIEASTSFVAQ